MGKINKALKEVKVMIIDDSSTIRKSAEIFLKSSGCEVIMAEDGFEAMHKIVDNQPDIIFIANANSGIIKDGGVKGAPDLIVEVLSGKKNTTCR